MNGNVEKSNRLLEGERITRTTHGKYNLNPDLDSEICLLDDITPNTLLNLKFNLVENQVSFNAFWSNVKNVLKKKQQQQMKWTTNLYRDEMRVAEDKLVSRKKKKQFRAVRVLLLLHTSRLIFTF